MLGIQSLAQLDALYGKAGAEVIRTNCCTKVIMPGLDHDTAEPISKALGETTVRQEYQSRRPEGWLVTSYSYGEHHTRCASATKSIPGVWVGMGFRQAVCFAPAAGNVVAADTRGRLLSWCERCAAPAQSASVLDEAACAADASSKYISCGFHRRSGEPSLR